MLFFSLFIFKKQSYSGTRKNGSASIQRGCKEQIALGALGGSLFGIYNYYICGLSNYPIYVLILHSLL